MTPVTVVGLSSGVIAVAAGMDHTCALTSGGAVKCWGGNQYGQLGDGSTTDRLTPVDVSGMSNGAIGLTVGGYHTCAVTSGGAVKCWGLNDSGQLGDGSTTDRTTPVAVTGLGSGIAALAGGTRHSCSLGTAGDVKCWGANKFGQLGDGTTTNRKSPVAVSGLGGGVALIGANSSEYVEAGHTCAVMTTGGVKCWGKNDAGQLGDGTLANQTKPVDVAGLQSGVKMVSTGYKHTCAVTDGGEVKCWGDNQFLQLTSPAPVLRALPADVAGLTSGVALLTSGGAHTCGLTTGGEVRCWGAGLTGQLGNGATANQGSPVAVCAGGASGCTASLSAVAMVAAGGSHTCAVTAAGGVKCWGWNDAAQLGDGTQGTNRTTPVDVVGLATGAAAVAAGGFHSCALTTAGGVKCWGVNNFGQLGDGTKTLRKTPVDVAGLSSGVVAVATGYRHTCALTGSGGVKCWGANIYGQLGDGTTAGSNSPVDVAGLTSGVTAIAAGYSSTCALTSASGVKCWGDNAYGQLGDGTTTQRLTPVDVAGLGNGVMAVKAEGDHPCALTTGGGVKCWGYGGDGEIGDGTTAETHPTPVSVIGLSSGATALSAGDRHTCALVGSGRVMCWGSDWYGALGLGAIASSATPVTAVAAAEPPILAANYGSARPGNFITLTGHAFRPNQTVTIELNGTPLVATARSSSTGEFIFFLDTTAASPGFYDVKTTANGDAGATTLLLAPEAPERVQEGGGLMVVVPAGIAVPANTLSLPRLLR